MRSIESGPDGASSERRRDAGAALVVATVSLLVVSALSLFLLSAVGTERMGVVLDADRLQATKLAEGALEVAETTFLSRLANYRPLPDPPAVAPFQVLDGTAQAGEHSIPWSVSRATSLDSAGEAVAIAAVNILDATTGLQVNVEPYVLEARLTVGTSTVRMRRHVEVRRIPIFQFLAYYAGDLEILPGPSMVLNGRIHSNSDLYMTAGNSLTVASKYVRAAGSFHRRRKDGGAAATGWIKMQDSQSNALATLPSQSDLDERGISSLNGLDSEFTGWDLEGDGHFDQPDEMPPFKNAVMDLFGGTLQTGEHGTRSLQNPEIASIQPYVTQDGGDYVQTGPGQFAHVAPGTGTHAKSYFHTNAGLVVIDGRVYDHGGDEITALMPAGFVTTRTVWDQRENRSVPCTQIDVGKLGDMDGDPATRDPSPYYPQNGLLFAARSGAAPGSSEGIVLTGGAELNVPARWNLSNYATGLLSAGATVSAPLGTTAPAGATALGGAEKMGLTVVSPAPVYIQGDYNTVAKKPAAVISDAVNLLSNAWDFSKASGQAKTASSTTYNVAMIMGHRQTDGSDYSGGFENLPRFHENWSGKTCTILGSFVSTWFSQIATGKWVYGGAWYDAPNRNWSYDASFDSGRLPPFTPMVMSTRHVAWEVSN